MWADGAHNIPRTSKQQIISVLLTLSVLDPLAAIMLGHFSGNFTRVLIHAIKNSKGFLWYFFHFHSMTN
jgi:hypothetical protein